MIPHILKIVWNRRSSNALIILEVFVSFIVVFALAAAAILCWRNFHRPLGYAWQDVWEIQFRVGTLEPRPDEALPAVNMTVERILRELEGMEPVIAAAAIHYPPYSQSSSTMAWNTSDDRLMRTEVISATPEAAQVLQIEMIAGRWFEPSDAALHWQPAVINRALAKDLFAGDDPLGKKIDFGDADGDEEPIDKRVVGIIEDYRRGGELAVATNVLVEPIWLAEAGRRASDLAIRLQPGTPAAFEEPLIQRLQELAPEWSFVVRPLTAQRDAYLRLRLAPLFAAGIVAGFLMIMVALGLLGVLWQNVTQRTLEVGLRRAKGATRPNIHWQILGEMMTLATFGIALGTLVIVQVPVLGWFSFLDLATYGLAFAVSVLAIYLLSALCGLYPSWLAARVQPAEALHYD